VVTTIAQVKGAVRYAAARASLLGGSLRWSGVAAALLPSMAAGGCFFSINDVAVAFEVTWRGSTQRPAAVVLACVTQRDIVADAVCMNE
jgi:hypothetical protein